MLRFLKEKNQKAQNSKLTTEINHPTKLINKIGHDQIKIQPKVCITNQKKRAIKDVKSWWISIKIATFTEINLTVKEGK